VSMFRILQFHTDIASDSEEELQESLDGYREDLIISSQTGRELPGPTPELFRREMNRHPKFSQELKEIEWEFRDHIHPDDKVYLPNVEVNDASHHNEDQPASEESEAEDLTDQRKPPSVCNCPTNIRVAIYRKRSFPVGYSY
jgi:hypothetical protein